MGVEVVADAAVQHLAAWAAVDAAVDAAAAVAVEGVAVVDVAA